ESTATKPGAITLPDASMISAPAGADTSAPTAAMRPFWITTVPRSITLVPVSTRPLVIATVWAMAGAAIARAATTERMRRRISGLLRGRWAGRAGPAQSQTSADRPGHCDHR